MDAERQQGRLYQRFLSPELEEGPRHDRPGDGSTEAGMPEEPQTTTASDPARALTERTSGTGRCKRERNRRIPLSTSGGVGGRGPRGPLPPDLLFLLFPLFLGLLSS